MYCLYARLVVSDVKCVRKFVRLMLLLWKIISHILNPEKCTNCGLCARKMSKENHYVNIKVQLTAEPFERKRNETFCENNFERGSCFALAGY